MGESWNSLTEDTLKNAWIPLFTTSNELTEFDNYIPNEWFAKQLKVDVSDIDQWFSQDGK